MEKTMMKMKVAAESVKRVVKFDDAEQARDFVDETKGRYCLLATGLRKSTALFRVKNGRLANLNGEYTDNEIDAAIRNGNLVGVEEVLSGDHSVLEKFGLL